MKSRVTYYYRYAAWLLLLVYLVNPLRVFQPFLTYQANYEYISSVLCVNKDKPKMECNGKCHLKKELKKQTENSAENQNSIVKLSLSEELSDSEVKIQKNENFLIEKSYYAFLADFYSDANLNSSTPPPRG